MSRLGRAQPFKPLTKQVMRGTMSFSQVLTEGAIGTDTVTSMKVKPATLTEGMIGTDSFVRSLARLLTEGAIGTDTALKAGAKVFTEGMIGTDTLTRVFTKLLNLSEGIIGTDKLSKLRNGSDVVWTHVTKAAAAVWSHISRS